MWLGAFRCFFFLLCQQPHSPKIPLRGLEGVPRLPGAPQDEAGLTRKFVQRMSALRLAGKPRGSSGVGLPAALAPGAGTEPPLRVPCPSSSTLAICSLLQSFSVSSFSPLFSVLPCSFSPFSPPCLPSFLSDPRPGFVRTLLTVPTTLPSLSDLPQLWEARGGCAVSTRSPLFPRLPGTAGLPLFRTLCT